MLFEGVKGIAARCNLFQVKFITSQYFRLQLPTFSTRETKPLFAESLGSYRLSVYLGKADQ